MSKTINHRFEGKKTEKYEQDLNKNLKSIKTSKVNGSESNNKNNFDIKHNNNNLADKVLLKNKRKNSNDNYQIKNTSMNNTQNEDNVDFINNILEEDNNAVNLDSEEAEKKDQSIKEELNVLNIF
jgi:hypothetical protein